MGPGEPVTAATHRPLLLQVDGTPGSRGDGMAGLGIVVRTLEGRVLAWHSTQAPARTNNEAEYCAVIAGLELVQRRFTGARVYCLTDSRLVVDQLRGLCAVRGDQICQLHARAATLVTQIGGVEFVAIPREVNRLADALAWEALGGRGWLLRVFRRREP